MADANPSPGGGEAPGSTPEPRPAGTPRSAGRAVRGDAAPRIGPHLVPSGRSVAAAAVAWVSVLVVMGGAAVGIGAILHAGGTGSFDHETWRWFVDHRSSALDGVAKGLTHVAATSIVIPLTVLISALLVWARRARDAAFVAASAAGAYLITAILKDVVARPRPPLAQRLVTENDWSFPSGHATQSLALYGALLVLAVASSGRGPRMAAWIAGTVFALAVGWTRLYLGVHWLSDVVGGWIIGGSWLAMLTWLMSYTRPGREGAGPGESESPGP